MSTMDIDLVCQQLCNSLDVIIDSNSGAEDRQRATQMVEEFKSNPNITLLIDVSFKLLNQTFGDLTKSIIYKHFGLQILEFIIKFHWKSMDQSLKQRIKQLMEEWFDLGQALVSPANANWRHLITGASRCIVEVLMREWPQNWPNFTASLLKHQSFLSLYCIWQLADDIGISFKPNNGQRRREMTNEFNRNLKIIYNFISNCLTPCEINLCLTSLSTLTVMFEWTQFDDNLFQLLVNMLSVDSKDSNSLKMKQSVCDCLLICLNRKQLKQSDRKALLTLFTSHNISMLVNTVREYVDLNAKDDSIQSLTKRLVAVMSEVGQQMIAVSEQNPIPTDVWLQCLDIMFSLFTHSNIILNASSVHFWFCFVKNYKRLSEENSLVTSLHLNLINQIPHKLSKQAFDSCIHGFEFDDSDDFDAFFFKLRADLIDLLRQLTILDQNNCFTFIAQILKKALMQSNSERNDWEILAQLSAAIFNKISDKDQYSSEASVILQLLIDKSNKEDPDVISSQLSCISALTIFLPHIHNNLLLQIIKWTLLLAAYTIEGQDKFNRTKEVKNLRRHACSLFIKICQTYPSLLASLFDSLKAHIYLICSDVQQFSQMEKCALNEGLILISNELPNTELQKYFIRELISSINWFTNYSSTADQFFYEIGLNENTLEKIELGNNRANLLYATNLIVAILKRTKQERTPSMAEEILPLLTGLFPLISNLNTIWRPEYQQKCSQSFAGLVYSDISECEKINILDMPYNGTNEHIKSKSDPYRMQNFIWSLHDLAFNALGLAVSALKPQIFEQIVDFKPVLKDIEFLPEWKLRMIIKNFIKPLIANCPQLLMYYERIGSIVISLLPYVFNKVNDRWNIIKSRSQTLNETTNEETEPIESEVICDQINRLLSKEFVDLLIFILVPNKSYSNDQSMDDCNHKLNDHNEVMISEFGNYLLTAYPNAIIYPTAKSLSWLDTTISLKTCNLNALLIKKIIDENMIQSEDGVYFLFDQLLTALSYFGEHEQNQSILLHLMLTLYEGIAVKLGFDSITLKLSEITATDLKDWNDFHQKLIKNNETKDKILFTDKRKKEFLKKLVSQVIGKNIGQMYKYNNVRIDNLKPIFCAKNNAVNKNLTEEDISLCLLFNDN